MTDPSDSPTFPQVVRPLPEAQVPVLVSVPHSGEQIPPDAGGQYALDPLRLLRDGDLYVDALYAGAVLEGATVVSTPWSRFVVDLNRRADDISPTSVQGGVRHQGEGYYGDRGLIWAVTSHGERIYRRPLTRQEYEFRLKQYYLPYHRLVQQELRAMRERFGFAVLLDAHSMPSRATRLHADPGSMRPDIIPGNLNGRSCDASLTARVASFWMGAGYQVTLNFPYSGGAITRLYGRPEDGIHAIQLELNRRLYMDEETLERADGFASLAEQCQGFVRALAAWSPEG
jgi:N-formylglutamate deformylase